MVEYKVGETAHINRRIRVKGQKGNVIKDLTIGTDAAVDIIAAHKSADAVAVTASRKGIYTPNRNGRPYLNYLQN